MKRIAVATLLAATAAIGLNAQAPKPTKAAIGPAKPITADGPQIGKFGLDEAGMDRSVQPGDDFYSYAGGTWLKETAIPADKGSYGAFDTLADLSRERTRGLLEAAKGSKIGDACSTYLDTAAIEAKGLAPAKPWLAKIAGLHDKAGYAALVAGADRNGVGIPFGGGAGQDAKLPETYIVGIRQSGLGLPDRD